MRKVNYEKFVETKRKRANLIWKVREEKLQCNRPRNKRERDILLKLDKARKESWLKKGKLEILAPRKYRLNIDFE